MSPFVGARIQFSNNGVEQGGTIVMIVKYDPNVKLVCRCSSQQECRKTCGYGNWMNWCRYKTLYIIYSKGEYFTSREVVVVSTFTKFNYMGNSSTKINSKSAGENKGTPIFKGTLTSDHQDLFSFYQLKKFLGIRNDYGIIQMSDYSTFNGRMDIRDSQSEKDRIIVRFGNGPTYNSYNGQSGKDNEYSTTEYRQMLNDLKPCAKPYKILTGSLDPIKFIDCRKQPSEFYYTTKRTDCGEKKVWKEMKFYVGIVKSPIEASLLHIFTDPKGQRHQANLTKKTIRPIPKDCFFKDEHGDEWIVDVNQKGNVERYIESVDKQIDLAQIQRGTIKPGSTYLKHTGLNECELRQIIDIKINYNIGDIFSGQNLMVIGIYLMNDKNKFRCDPAPSWEIKYLVAPFKKICPKSGRIEIDTSKYQLLKHSAYKSSVMDQLEVPQAWLPKNTNEISFQLPNKSQVIQMFIDSDPKYKAQRQKSTITQQKFNSLCFGKRKDGRYCMHPVRVSGDFCDEHGGPTNLSMDSNPAICSYVTHDFLKTKSIYKLTHMTFERTLKFMYDRENIDHWKKTCHWKPF